MPRPGIFLFYLVLFPLLEILKNGSKGIPVNNEYLCRSTRTKTNSIKL